MFVFACLFVFYSLLPQCVTSNSSDMCDTLAQALQMLGMWLACRNDPVGSLRGCALPRGQNHHPEAETTGNPASLGTGQGPSKGPEGLSLSLGGQGEVWPSVKRQQLHLLTERKEEAGVSGGLDLGFPSSY